MLVSNIVLELSLVWQTSNHTSLLTPLGLKPGNGRTSWETQMAE